MPQPLLHFDRSPPLLTPRSQSYPSTSPPSFFLCHVLTCTRPDLRPVTEPVSPVEDTTTANDSSFPLSNYRHHHLFGSRRHEPPPNVSWPRAPHQPTDGTSLFCQQSDVRGVHGSVCCPVRSLRGKVTMVSAYVGQGDTTSCMYLANSIAERSPSSSLRRSPSQPSMPSCSSSKSQFVSAPVVPPTPRLISSSTESVFTRSPPLSPFSSLL